MTTDMPTRRAADADPRDPQANVDDDSALRNLVVLRHGGGPAYLPESGQLGTGDERWEARWPADDEDGDFDDAALIPGEVNAVDDGDMATWSGQASIKGSSEAVRMVLLTFTSIGITSVPVLLCFRPRVELD